MPDIADDEQKQRQRVIGELGGYPETAREYVALAARRFATSISFRGSIRVEHMHGHASSHDLARDMRIMATELKLKLSKADINDAVDRFIVV